MTETPDISDRCRRPVRAYLKIIGVAGVLGVVLGALITFVSRAAVNDLRHHLTLWHLIAIVAAINVTFFFLFALSWVVYRWIKRDLEPEYED